MKCHKIVLAAGSPELKERMVQAGKDGHPGWVSVVREDWKSFVALLGVFYSQKLELTAKNVWGIEQGNAGFYTMWWRLGLVHSNWLLCDV